MQILIYCLSFGFPVVYGRAVYVVHFGCSFTSCFRFGNGLFIISSFVRLLVLTLYYPSYVLRFNGCQNINHIRQDVNSRHQHRCSLWGTAVLWPTVSLMYQPLLTDKLENQCTEKWQGMGKKVTAEKPAPLPLPQPQISHEQPRDSTRVFAVRSWRVNPYLANVENMVSS